MPEKLLWNRFLEPLIMFHEYLFNSKFRLLRKTYGVSQLFKEAVAFYAENKSRYVIPKKLDRYLTWKYKGITSIRYGKFFKVSKFIAALS